MKRILILLCLPLLFSTCKKEEKAPNNNGNNQHSIVGKKWSGYVPNFGDRIFELNNDCLLYTSPSPRDVEESRMPSSA